MSYVPPADRTQLELLTTLDDAVAPNHYVRLIDLLVEQIVQSNPAHFGTPTTGDVGRPSFSPQTMLKLYLYGYLNSIRSSRKLERETERNIELMWLLGKLSPDHWTIAQYRQAHQEDIRIILKQFQAFLRDNNFVQGHRVAIDGSKVKANAKRDMLTPATIAKRLQRLDEQSAHYLAALATNDIHEDLTDELDQLDAGTPREQYLSNKIAALQTKLDELEQHKALLATTQRTALSPTDPDAELMKTRDGKQAGYNVQIVVDDAYKLIAASDVLTDQSDSGALPKMVEALREQTGIVPKEIVADKGYHNPDLIERVERATTSTCFIPPQREDNDNNGITFLYDAITDSYQCSEGKPLVLRQKNKRQAHTRVNVYSGTECTACRLRHLCTKSPKGRMIIRYHNQLWRDRFKERMRTPAAQHISTLRKTLVEHPFGTIKLWGGKLPLLLRGLDKVKTEIMLYTLTYNLKRMLTIVSIESFRLLVHKYRWTVV